MPTVDELGRAAATRLRAEVHPDVEAGLRRLHASAPAGERDRRRWWALGGAAAVAVLAIAGFVVLRQSPTGRAPATIPGTLAPTVPAPTAIAPPSTPVAPAPTTVPNTSVATPTQVVTTTAAPSRAAPTTAPPTTVTAPSDVAVFATPPAIDLPAALVALPLPGCDPSCPSVATRDGTVVAWDADEQQFHVLGPADSEARPLALRAPGLTGDMLVAVGPDQVAYLLAHATTGTIEDGWDMVAVPLRGPNAGTVVATAAKAGDMSGDTDFAPTHAGLAAVSCCDLSPVRPDPHLLPAMAWVDSSGRPIGDDTPMLIFDATPEAMAVSRGDQPEPMPVGEALGLDPSLGPGAVRGMPLLAAGDDGSVLVAAWPATGSEWRVARARPDGSSERIVGPPDDVFLLALDSAGAIVADGATIARWQIPGYGAPAPFNATTLLDGRTFATSDAAVAALLDALRADDGCEVAPSAELAGAAAQGDEVVARVEARSGCDDSGAGLALAVRFVLADGVWSTSDAVSAPLCRRGVTGGLCV